MHTLNKRTSFQPPSELSYASAVLVEVIPSAGASQTVGIVLVWMFVFITYVSVYVHEKPCGMYVVCRYANTINKAICPKKRSNDEENNK